MTAMAKIGVTGATGALGAIVLKDLIATLGADSVVALVRSPAKAADLGVAVRHADYDKPETLVPALEGIEKLLLVSSPDLGERVRQHSAVVDAAKAAGIKHIVYTSSLKTTTSKVEPIAQEDRETEALIKQSGIPYTVLRNGFYTENHLQALEGSLAAGAFFGCAGQSAKFSCAPRADYAAAVAVVLTSAPGSYEGQTLELAGDPETAYTLPELAAEVTKQTGKVFPYQDIPREEYVKVLTATGLPDIFAEAYALFDLEAAEGGLFHNGRELSMMIGRPTAPLSEVLPAWLPTTASA